MFVRSEIFSKRELSRFRELQTLSFSIIENCAAELHGGETEKEVAPDLVLRFREAGFSSFFHLPVVLFGERAALPGAWKTGNFYPKKKTLLKGDSVIMDASPICDGYLVDTPYSFCFGENLEHRDMMGGLAEFRASICGAVNEGRAFKKIACDVEQRFAVLGFEPAHGKHPGGVLGHRAIRMTPPPKDGARWLDEEPPHVRQWANIAAGRDYGPLQ